MKLIVSFSWIYSLSFRYLLENKFQQKAIPQGLQIPVTWIYYSVFAYYMIKINKHTS